jgi:hypothetical protein
VSVISSNRRGAMSPVAAVSVATAMMTMRAPRLAAVKAVPAAAAPARPLWVIALKPPTAPAQVLGCDLLDPGGQQDLADADGDEGQRQQDEADGEQRRQAERDKRGAPARQAESHGARGTAGGPHGGGRDPGEHRRDAGGRACQASSSRSASAGLTTTSPASQDVPWPPPSGTGREPAAPKAASTAGGGNGIGRTYPAWPYRSTASTTWPAGCRAAIVDFPAPDIPVSGASRGPAGRGR